MIRAFLCLGLLFGLARMALALDTADIPLADGFDLPVGKNGKSYYKARGVRPNGHLGEDWNGTSGGDTDLGDPIYSAADGIVTFAQDYRLGWGNVVIIRSAYLENGDTKYVDSLYGHLLDFSVRYGQKIERGQQIGRMGSNRGMYPAHLHFEMRKNINVGMYRSSFPRDWSIYWSPSEFVAAHRTCSGGGRIVSAPINTYAATPPPLVASTKVYTPSQTIAQAMANGTVVGGPTRTSSPLRRVYANSPRSSSVGSGSGSSGSRIYGESSGSSTISRTVATAKPTPKPTQRVAATGPTKKVPTPVKPGEKVKPKRTLFRVERFEDMRVLGYE